MTIVKQITVLYETLMVDNKPNKKLENAQKDTFYVVG